MDAFAEIVAAILGAAAVFLLVVLVAPLIGAASGWIVGLVFEDTIRLVLSAFGVRVNFEIWQLGATLAFIGGFFKTINRTGK